MDTLATIADNRHQLLTKQARALILRPGMFVADEIAPNISRAGLVLGSALVADDINPVPDQLGELMDPNLLDVNKALPKVDFVIEDHELQAKVSKRFSAAMHELGFDDGQIDEIVTSQLISKVRAMREITTAKITTTSGNYASGMYDTSAKAWNTSGGDPAADISAAIAALEGKGAPTDSIYMAASPAVWAALRGNADIISRFSGITAAVTNEAIAGIFGAHAVNVRYQAGGSFVTGESMQIYCRPEVPMDDSLCAWRTVNAGQSGSPEPTIYKYQPQGREHRYYTIGCYHDYKVVATGGNKSGKQQWGYLYTDVLS